MRQFIIIERLIFISYNTEIFFASLAVDMPNTFSCIPYMYFKRCCNVSYQILTCGKDANNFFLQCVNCLGSIT
jgi:hypothetical protein